LSEDGKTVKWNEPLLAFSTGKRVCVGEVMARDEIYLVLTNIVSKYQVLPDPADPKPSIIPTGAFSLEAKPYTVIFKDRVQ
jgi:cytochrome P450 family 2 subfamily U polypeptide 1